MRSSSIRRTSSPSSANVRPIVPPAPAVFSSSSGQPSVAARAFLNARAIIAIERETVRSPFPLPGCTTTPPAPMASPTRSACVSEASDFLRTCASSLQTLIR